MRFVNWNVAFATWLLVSAFALPNTPASMAILAVSAFLVPIIALYAGARPGARYVISLMALALAVLMIVLPHVSVATRVSTWLMAALFFALSLINPRHASMHVPAHR